jgi:hypothetical protein
MFSNSFAGIQPSSAPAFIGAQIVGGLIAVGVIRALYPSITPEEAGVVLVPHPPDSARNPLEVTP